MELNINEFGIHSYKPNGKAVLRIKKVSGNKKGFTKRQVNGTEREKSFLLKNWAYISQGLQVDFQEQ